MAGPAPGSPADRLLDAQVAWLLARLSGAQLTAHLDEDIDDLLRLAAGVTVADAVAPEAVADLIKAVLTTVPASAAGSTATEIVADVVAEGPTGDVTAADLLDRDQVEALLGAVLGHTEVVGLVLDKVAESPMVAAVASRFVARIVGDVLATNKAVADKIPGMGSLMSLGTSMAGLVAGAADKQFEAVFGDSATGKSATFAVRRLNKLVLETLKDPATLAAALEVYDMYANESLAPLLRDAAVGDRDSVQRLAGLVQDVLISAAPTPPVRELVDRLVDGFYRVYGEESLAALIEDLGIGREEIGTHARVIVPPLLEAVIASGEVERMLRERLAPFFGSDEVAAILR